MGVSTEEDTEDGKIFFKESQYIKCLFFSGAVPSIVCVIQLKAGFLWLRTSSPAVLSMLTQGQHCGRPRSAHSSAASWSLLIILIRVPLIHKFIFARTPWSSAPPQERKAQNIPNPEALPPKKLTLYAPFPDCLSSQLPRCKVSAKPKCALMAVPSLLLFFKLKGYKEW